MPLLAQLIESPGVGSLTGTTKPVDRKTMRMPCITSTLHVTHAGQTSPRVFDSQTHFSNRVTQVKRTYVLKCTSTAELSGQRGVTAVKGDLHVVHTGHCQDIPSQPSALPSTKALE